MALAVVGAWLMEELNPSKRKVPRRYQLVGRWAAASRETVGVLRLPLAVEAHHKCAVVDWSLAWLKARLEEFLHNLPRVHWELADDVMTHVVQVLQRKVAAVEGWTGGPLHMKLQLLRSVARVPWDLPFVIATPLYVYSEEIYAERWLLCRVPQT